MIIPDVNLLVYAYNDEAQFHEPARVWWEGAVNGTERVGVPWVVSTGFVRLMTHPKVLTRPVNATQAVGYVLEWFAYPHVIPINPGVSTSLTSDAISPPPVWALTWLMTATSQRW